MNCILHANYLKLRIENLEIKTKSVKTSNSVSGINSDGLAEKSETSVDCGLIQWEDFFSILLFFHMSL